MVDCVLTYHTNAATCGTAKFNLRLARELGVPCYQVETPAAFAAKHPLLSLRQHECNIWRVRVKWEAFSIFLHESTDAVIEWLHEHHPVKVYAGNADIAEKVRKVRADVIEAWCPSTIEGNPHRGTINILTFGMAHKVQTQHYEKLKQLLDATGEDYTVSVSTAIHEGSPWDETAHAADKLRAIFGDRLRVLGYLADDALVAEMARCSAVALFYDPALRANNTTFWSALQAGKAVISNADPHSPQFGGWYHIDDVKAWSHLPAADCDGYAMNGRYFSQRYGWAKLATLLQGQPCVK